MRALPVFTIFCLAIGVAPSFAAPASRWFSNKSSKKATADNVPKPKSSGSLRGTGKEFVKMADSGAKSSATKEGKLLEGIGSVKSSETRVERSRDKFNITIEDYNVRALS
ncbi:hypothetical protein F5148DRAFT_1152059 [Russula earlei]|uniref:Uncharacterized protein n=1 Tax=Russula earlei TaxID=71964 RepID=A0ACC0TYS0_9AGAM|nr:hypothetical protein F5148DRAFT_1152059 [Russula earlei]